MENDTLKKTILFKKNLSEIPCFRNSYLYGISTGLATGLMYFMFTSKIRMSSHIAFGTFAVTTLSYWAYCRYNWQSESENIVVLKEFLKDKVENEGTPKDSHKLHNADTKPNSLSKI